MPAALNLIDQRFGRLLVQERADRDKYGAYLWLCMCDCGKASVVRGSQLCGGVTQSCGCGVAISASRPRTHGQSRTALYRRWRSMLDRCGNPRNSEYANYGGRGIDVFPSWKSFERFAADMAGSFDASLELDRQDTNGNYEPGNCRWISRAQQQLNKRTNHRIAWRGLDLTVTEWGTKLQLNPSTILYRLRRGWSTDRALTTGADQSALIELANG